VVIIALIPRLYMEINCAPAADPDTPSHLELASDIGSMSFGGWDASRTPVFPLLLLAGGRDFDTARLLQTLIGIATAALLAVLIMRRTNSSLFGILGGAAYALDLGAITYESAMMSETVCTFFLLASVAALERTVSRPSAREGVFSYGVAGLLSGITALTRPLYAFLLFIYFPALVKPGERKGSAAPRARRVAAFVVPAAGLMLAWCVFNWSRVGYFGLMSTVGFGLSNHSGEFIELAPERYAPIREPYLRVVRRQIAESGSRSEAIFEAAPEIYRETGWTEVELSRRLTRMSVEMFIAHPLLYARTVLRGWNRFWIPDAYFGVPNQFYNPAFGGFVRKLWKIQKRVWFAVNVLFLLIAVWSVLQLMRGRSSMDFDCNVIAVVLAASVVQAALELGENSRYSVPTVPLVVYVVTVWLCKVWHGPMARMLSRSVVIDT
jgi:hypothetical protein